MPRVSPYFDLKRDEHGNEFLEVSVTGIALLRLVLTNKGTAFTEEERLALGLDGLLPPEINTLDQQIERVYRGFWEEQTPIARYQYLRQLQERQEILFYALLEKHLDEMLPIVYTPTVGQAVQEFHSLYQSPRGISLSPRNIDRAEAALGNYPLDDVRLIVVTDSSAILGIGDQGYGGLAIPIGKLALYTVAGGVSPFHTMPVALDVGTGRADLIEDPFYLGARQPRLKGEAYDAFVEKFVRAVRKRWPRALIQWEDLAKDAAFSVLERFRKVLPSFNDDIQGTGAVALSGVLRACALKNESLADQVFVIHGAGAGGVGVAWALKKGLEREGLSPEDAAARIFVLDSRGLLTTDRPLEAYKRPFAQPGERIESWSTRSGIPNLMETLEHSGATCLLGLSGQAGAFTEEVVRAVSANASRPIVFALSNPTASSEARPADILRWTHGRALVATGSPFAPVIHDGRTVAIGQGNNAFIFPGLGFGAVLAEATEVTDDMVLEAAAALADYTREHHPDRIYPPVARLKEASISVAARVARAAARGGVATRELPAGDLRDYVRSRFWLPRYIPVVPADSATPLAATAG